MACRASVALCAASADSLHRTCSASLSTLDIRSLASLLSLVRRFTQRMDLREHSGVTCVNLQFRSVGVTCVNLCLTTRPDGRKKGQNMAALKSTLANA